MTSLFSRHSLLLQTAFAELKRQALEQEFLLIGTPGSVGPRNRGESGYLYRQFYNAQGRKDAEYIGPVGDLEAEARAEKIRAQIALTRELLRQARVLNQQGYVRTDKRTGAILASLVNYGLFEAGAVLIGSHAFGVLINLLGVASAGFSTEDVDVARNAPLEIALDDSTGFLEILRESTIPLVPIPTLRRGAPSTSYRPPGVDRLRVDLLVPAQGSEIGIREVPELKAHATSLPFLDYLLHDPIVGVVLGRECLPLVRIPKVERFAWHKMLVSSLRGTADEKSSKDVWHAAVLFAILAEDGPESLERAYLELPMSARSKTLDGARRVRAVLQDAEHERGLDVLQEMLT